MTLVLLVSALAGTASTTLITVINKGISGQGPVSASLVWGFAGLCLLLPIARISSEVLLTYFAQNAVYDFRMKLCRQVLAAPLRNLEQQGADKLLTTLTADIATITAALIMIPHMGTHLVIVVSCLGYLFWLFPLGGIILIVTTVLGVLVYLAINKTAMGHYQLARNDSDGLYGHFRTLILGTKELKLHYRRRKAFLDEVLHETADSFKRNHLRARIYFGVAGSFGQLLFFIAIGLLIFGVPALDPSINKSVVTGYTLVLLYLFVPLDSLTTMVPGLAAAAISLEKVKSLGISLENMPVEPDQPPSVETRWTSLELNAVTHSYHREKEDRNFTLGPISFALQPGELTFLIGGNGSGKTTLAKLITGLYMPEDGEIIFNGEPVQNQNRETYRQYFSVVFSDFFLFDSMLGMNDKESASLDEQALKYLNQLQLNHKVEVNKGALSTLDLSQGQRKRLALLTAYLEDRPIYLFDEWAADQDPLFKGIFYESLLPELKSRGKTVLVISHDDHYYHVADRLIKIDSGKLEYDKVIQTIS